jgi:glycosyltransferase involved in cell wall biosynthesis
LNQSEQIKKKRQLLFVWNYLEWGGAQIYFLAIMKEAKNDWEIKVIMPRGSSAQFIGFLEKIGIEYELTDFSLDLQPADNLSRKLKRQWNKVKSELLIYKHLLRYQLKESILHIETAPWQSWQLLLALTRRGNVFVTMHNRLPQTSGWRLKLWKTRFGLISKSKNFHLFASNQDTKNSLREFVSPEFWETIKVTYTAINPLEIDEALRHEFSRETLCQKHGLPMDKFIVLCVGQFIDRKGRWTFLEAVEKVVKERDDIVFVWLSPTLPNDEDRKIIENYQVKDKFHLILSENVGQNRQDVLTFFRLADVFTLPSFIEGLPIALLEAMALGIPSISTDINAIPETIKHLETGWLIEAGDSEALAQAIVELKNDEELREKLGKNGHEFVIVNFDERVAARTAIQEYEKCFLS